MKTLGCKVSNEIYQQFKDLGRPISYSLREAITLYLQDKDKQATNQGNHTETTVNRNNDNHPDHPIHHSSTYPQRIPNQYTTQEKHNTDKTSPSKHHDHYQNTTNTTRTFHYNNDKLQGTPSQHHILQSNRNRIPPLNKESQLKKSYYQMKKKDDSSTPKTQVQCKYCTHKFTITRRYHRTEQIICPNCKQRIYL